MDDRAFQKPKINKDRRVISYQDVCNKEELLGVNERKCGGIDGKGEVGFGCEGK